MGKRRIMRSFRLMEISGVDSPAQIHARAAIIKRHDPGVDKAKRPMSAEEEDAFDAHGAGPVHEILRAKYDGQLRSYTHQSPEQAFAAAFRSLPSRARDELRAEESGEAQAREAEDAARLQAARAGALDKRAARTRQSKLHVPHRERDRQAAA
jgi:hypothetical protein